ncbi:MAG: N-acetyltransferase [Pseudomonadota bacterium]
MFHLTTERPSDGPAIEKLLDAAFGGPARHSKRSYHYRQGVAPDRYLRLVARSDANGALLGTIRYWPVSVGGSKALLLGPVAALPALKGKGIGKSLIWRSLDMASWANHRLVLLVGDLGYYGQFGFGPAADDGISMPGEQQDRLQCIWLDRLARGQIAGSIERWGGSRTRITASPFGSDDTQEPSLRASHA